MDVTPRKQPRQARAKATVDAIVEATIQVLLRDGYAQFTTGRAAERAGVSVGSLYQYFPNKAALASAVIDRCCDNFILAFESALAERPCATLEESIRAIIDVTLITHHLTPELHRIVLELAPRLGVEEKARMVSRKATETIEAVLRNHGDEIADDIDLPVAATMIETVLEAIAHRVLRDRMTRSEEARLAAEAMRLVFGYLALKDEGGKGALSNVPQ